MASIEVQQRRQAEAVFKASCDTSQLDLDANYFDYLYQVASWLANHIVDGSKKTLGVSGAQGSGKSTFSLLLADLLREVFKLDGLVLSLDDFYLTREERRQLARDVHPLLETRGVPGTHDINKLLAASAGFVRNEDILLPEFSKPNDDRIAEHSVATDDIQLLIFEGWCWGAKPASEDELQEPINQLERQEDPAGVWRRYVNQQLAIYQPAFDTDFSIFLQVPDFEAIKRWRWQQEQGLPYGPRRMTEAQIARFIMHYERITRALLKAAPETVDICLTLAQDHAISGLKTR